MCIFLSNAYRRGDYVVSFGLVGKEGGDWQSLGPLTVLVVSCSQMWEMAGRQCLVCGLRRLYELLLM